MVVGWIYALEEDILAEGTIRAADQQALVPRTAALLEQRLAKVTSTASTFSAALRGYREAQARNDKAASEGILAWLSGQPNVAAAAKRSAGVKGDIDHFGALSFLQGVLIVLRGSGHPGLLLVLDEVETIQRVRGDVRDKSLNALRQLIDEVDSGRFPGLYLLITGTPAFYDGPQGAHRLEPLAQRLHVDFQTANVVDALRRAADILEPHGLVMVLEPLNTLRNHPGMYLTTTPQAHLVCKAVGSPSCKILFPSANRSWKD